MKILFTCCSKFAHCVYR